MPSTSINKIVNSLSQIGIIWQPKKYTKKTVVLVNDVLYILKASTPFTSIDFTTELANGDWEVVGGSSIEVVLNYDALPSASSNSGRFYWCEESQGTKWLPFSLGGTYYNNGLYYSNGVNWTYLETPIQATEAEVVAGVNNDKFVTPYTLQTVLPTKTSDLVNDGDNGVSHFISSEDLPSNLIIYPTNIASDISGYYKIVSSITDPDFNTVAVDIPTGTITTTSQLIAQLATSNGLINGNPGVFNITTIGNIKHTSGSGTAEFYFEVYKRTSAGVETLITTSGATLPVLNSGYTEFSASAIWNDGLFVETDRIVLKFYANRIAGGSNPNYAFQFGGIAPVRALLPIPLTVVPKLKISELSDVLISSKVDGDVLCYESASNLWKNKQIIGSWVDYSASSTVVGWSSFTTKSIQIFNYNNKFLIVNIYLDGTSNSTSASITIPNNATVRIDNCGVRCGNLGVFSVYPGLAYILNGTNIIAFSLNNSGAGFTATGNKIIICQITVKIS